MSLALPHVDAGKVPTKNSKAGVPAPATPVAQSFADKLKAQVALKAQVGQTAAPTKVEAKADANAAATEKAASAAKANKTELKLETPVAKVDRKPEPKKKEAPADNEAALAAAPAVPPPVAQPISAAKAAREDSAFATEAAAEKNKSQRNAPKLPAEKNAEAPKNGLNEQRFDTMVKTETKKTEREAGPKVSVIDKRTEKDKAKKADSDAMDSVTNQAVPAQAVVSKTETKPIDGVQVVFQTVTGKPKDNFDTPAKSTPVAPQDAAAFQKFLVEKGYGQLVEQARIILKNDNQGEIRMTLYPETLGKIKVALNLSDSHLAGEIFVENQTVKEILQDNMGQLLQSFREGGFGDMNIQVSVGDGSGQKSAGENPSGFHAAGYDRQVSTSGNDLRPDERISTWSDRQVNLTA
jgi:flagellar hook-length control protein FliK